MRRRGYGRMERGGGAGAPAGRKTRSTMRSTSAAGEKSRGALPRRKGSAGARTSRKSTTTRSRTGPWAPARGRSAPRPARTWRSPPRRRHASPSSGGADVEGLNEGDTLSRARPGLRARPRVRYRPPVPPSARSSREGSTSIRDALRAARVARAAREWRTVRHLYPSCCFRAISAAEVFRPLIGGGVGRTLTAPPSIGSNGFADR